MKVAVSEPRERGFERPALGQETIPHQVEDVCGPNPTELDKLMKEN